MSNKPELDEQAFLNSLSDSQKQQLFLLLKENPIGEKPPVKTKPRQKQKRRQKRKSTQESSNDSGREPTKKRRTKRKPSKSRTKKHNSKIPSGKTVAKRESFTAESRQNKFLNGGDFNKHKKDSNVDKKLSGDNELTERNRATSYVAAVCSKCEYEFDDVPIYECYQDDDGLRFTCNECSARR